MLVVSKYLSHALQADVIEELSSFRTGRSEWQQSGTMMIKDIRAVHTDLIPVAY